MKKLFLLLIFLGSLFAELTYPKWYLSHDFKSKNEIFYGYGYGKSIEEAKKKARSDISRQIATAVDVETSITKTASKDEYSKELKSKNTQKSTAILSQEEVVKVERLGDLFFVALLYNNTPKLAQFAKELKKIGCKEFERSHNYLTFSQLVQDLDSLSSCQREYTLLFSEAKWYLSFKDKTFFISKSYFNPLIYAKESRLLKVSHKNMLRDKESFFFNFDSKTEGYLHIFNIFGYGKAALVDSNVKLKKGEFQYPKKGASEYFQASLPKGAKISREGFVFLITDKRKSFSHYDDSYEKNFISLIRDSSFNEFVSTKIAITD